MQQATQQPAQFTTLGPPEEIDAETLAFCATISPHAPFYVDAVPESDARPAYCFDNSVRQAELHGGEAAYGWAIWRWPGRWFEAEHHAVWHRPDGSFLDVTPQPGNPSRILFLPQPEAVYDPETYRRNVMAPDGGNALAAEYIELAGRRSQITHKYWYPGVEVLPLFSPEDQARIAPLDARMNELRQSMIAQATPAAPSDDFARALDRPDHPLHEAWRELLRPVTGDPSRGRVADKRVQELLATIRREHPELETRFDPRRVALWKPLPGNGTILLYAGLCLLPVLAIGYLAFDTIRRMPPLLPTVPAPAPPLPSTYGEYGPPDAKLSNQRVDTDRALESLFGDSLAISDLDISNPSLTIDLQRTWNEAHERGAGQAEFVAAVAAQLHARFVASIPAAAPEYLLEYYRIRLDAARALQATSPNDCAGFVLGTGYDTALIPAEIVDRERRLAARVLPDAQQTELPAQNLVLPAEITAGAAGAANLPVATFNAALRGQGNAQAQCGAWIGLWQTLLASDHDVELLRRL